MITWWTHNGHSVWGWQLRNLCHTHWLLRQMWWFKAEQPQCRAPWESWLLGIISSKALARGWGGDAQPDPVPQEQLLPGPGSAQGAGVSWRQHVTHRSCLRDWETTFYHSLMFLQGSRSGRISITAFFMFPGTRLETNLMWGSHLALEKIAQVCTHGLASEGLLVEFWFCHFMLCDVTSLCFCFLTYELENARTYLIALL